MFNENYLICLSNKLYIYIINWIKEYYLNIYIYLYKKITVK
jgi:hypothetical protein